MKLQLTDVSQQRLRKQGILCSSVVIGKDLILLHKIDKDVALEKHNHPHAQLGYCFNGHFDFEVEGANHSASKGYSYLLDGGVYHAAFSKTEYYSLDIKAMLEGALSQQMIANVFTTTVDNEGYALQKAQVGNWEVQKITFTQIMPVDIKIDIARKNYIFVSAHCSLNFGDLLSDLRLESMKIYQLEVDKPEFAIASDKAIEVIIASF